MPDDGSKLCSVAVLADDRRQVELAIPLDHFERITDYVANRAGMVTSSIGLSREEGRVIAEVTLATHLNVLCQRCLQPMSLPVQSSSRVALLESEAAASEVPPELETALAPEGRMRLADLVEEELLLALPAAPRHPGQCPGEPQPVPEEAPEIISETTQRPFAALGELLSRRTKQ